MQPDIIEQEEAEEKAEEEEAGKMFIFDGYRELAKAVICQAGKDASKGDPDARYWLEHLDEENIIGCLAGNDLLSIREWARAGCKNSFGHGSFRGKKNHSRKTGNPTL